MATPVCGDPGNGGQLALEGKNEDHARELEGTEPTNSFRNALAANLGNVLEWYDFALFGYFATEFGELFFPPASATANLLESFAVFGGAFIVRPLGGMFFGRIGDTLGRNVALKLSVALMTFSSVAMAILPPYSSIGIFSTLLLVALRLFQGLSVGGQLSGSFVFCIENAPPGRRGLYGSLGLATASWGTGLGSLGSAIVHASLEPEQVLSYGWRIAYLLGMFFGLAALCLQHRAEESPEFVAMQKSGRIIATPIKTVLVEHPGKLLKVTIVATAWCVGFYLSFVWLQSYKLVLEHETSSAQIVNTVMLLVVPPIACPLYGMLADHLSMQGHKGLTMVLTFGASLGVALVVPAFLLVSLKPAWGMLCGQILMSLSVFAIGASLPTFMTESFEPELRYSGIAISYNISQALFGGTAPFLATALYSATKSILPVAMYVATINVCMLLVLHCTGEAKESPQSNFGGCDRALPDAVGQTEDKISVDEWDTVNML